MKSGGLKILKLFIIHYLLVVAELLLFRGLIAICFLPLGIAMTILGYLTSVIGIIVVSVTTGMMLAFIQKKNSLSTIHLSWMFPFATIPGILSLKYFFDNEWQYVLIVSIPTIILSLIVILIGKKTLNKK